MAAVSDDLYECVRLFKVQENSPVAGGETPFHSFNGNFQSSSVTIELSCYKETNNYSILALITNNGYIVLRLEPFLCPPIIRQLKWFEGRPQHILGITLDPLGEWLACACLDGCIYLIPVLSLLMPDSSPSHVYGSLEDMVKIEPIRKVSPPTAIVWWEAIDGSQICITGSELGEITFFNLLEKKEVALGLNMRGCINQLLIAHRTDHTSHLLINLRGGEWWWILLEERYHEAEGESYSDVQAKGFEVVFDDAVLRSILVRSELSIFEPKLFHDFSEITKLSIQECSHSNHMLGSVNLKESLFELYSYNFDINTAPLHSFKLMDGTLSVLASERVLFVLSQTDGDSYTFNLSVISRELSQRNFYQMPSNAIVQDFALSFDLGVVGFYITNLESHRLASEPRELTTPTNLGGCVVVTSATVYQCRQKRSPESLFMKSALSEAKSHNLTDEIAIKYKLDIYGLYKIAAEYNLSQGNYKTSLKLYQLSKTPPLEIIKNFVAKECISELVSFLQEVVYDESTLAPSSNPKVLQNILFKCFVHQYLEVTDLSEKISLKEYLNQFINDKFLYDHQSAMKILIKCGLIDQLFELAKVHHKVPEALELLLNQGSSHLPLSLETMIATKQFAHHLATTDNGVMFYQLNSINAAKCAIAQPLILEHVLCHMVMILSKLDATLLTRLARILDPSRSTIQTLLRNANSTLKRSGSTGSITSMVSSEGYGGVASSPSVSDYIEAFIKTLIMLQQKREKQTPPTSGLLSLSPLLDKIGSTPEEKALRPMTTFVDGSKVLVNKVISCGYNHAALVNTNGELYTWGCTKNGKLGHGDIELQWSATPLRVEMFSMLSVHVIAVSCGAEHTVAVCQEGVYSWGSSTHGQLGHGDTLKRSRPVQIASLANTTLVTLISGHYHCLALDENHYVWVWGWGIHGQLGLGTCNDVMVPTHAVDMDSLLVSSVAAGYNHSAVICQHGRLYTFGNAMYGQLGHGDQDKQSNPRMVEALASKVIYLVSCGSSHTVAVSSDQTVFYWGKNLHKPHPGSSPQGLKQYTRSRREGARSPAVANALLPIEMNGVELNGDVIFQVSCGNSHCLLLLVSGKVLSWGSNLHGQIGHTHIPELSQPKAIDKLENHMVMCLSAGDEFSAGVDGSGITWVWGRNDSGQLGMDFGRRLQQPGKKVCIFAPNPNPQIPKITYQMAFDKAMSPDAHCDETLLHIDLDWKLPDFSSIGDLYGRGALTQALHSLYGYYRTTHILSYCNQNEDWPSIIEICIKEKQWQQVIEWHLCSLSSGDSVVQLTSVLSIVRDNLSLLVADSSKFVHTRDFIVNSSKLLEKLVSFWLKHELPMIELENTLFDFLSSLSYPLSILFKRKEYKDTFSYKFTFQVTSQIIREISGGVPALSDILNPPSVKSTIEKSTAEMSQGDLRMWSEVLRNLFKDLAKHDSLIVSDVQLTQRTSENDVKSFVAFTCGHAFSENEFQRKVLHEFRERLEDFPRPLTQTNSLLLHYYKHSSKFSSACPYCVFQHLRQTQLQYSPGVAIRPWNP